MKKGVKWFAIVVGLVLAGFSGCTCQKGTVRPGPPFDGSARWALGLAQPRITAFAADAELRQILGARIAPDGRLFANVGTWSMVAFSPSQQKQIQVNVNANGSTTESISASTGVGVQVPLPSTFLNSPEVFDLVRTHVPAFAESTLVTLNLTNFGGDLDGAATWGVNTPSNNVLVKFDGTIHRLQ